MSAAPAPAAAAPGDAPAAGGGKKKLVILLVAVLVLVLAGGGGAFYMMKKKAAEEAAAADGEEGGGGHAAAHEPKKPPPKDHKADGHPPAFVALEPFTINLADKDADRFAQVGLSLQIEDPKVADEIKAYMPAIRNAALMILSHKTSQELLSPEGKEKMAEEIRRETARAMGYEVEDPEEEVEDSPKKKKKKRRVELYNPIAHVHYSNFIVQ